MAADQYSGLDCGINLKTQTEEKKKANQQSLKS